MAVKYKQGRYKPIFPKKYRGNLTNIVFRSSWEYRVMKYLDQSEKIMAWNSEEVVIPYRDPWTDRPRRYFIDFWIAVKSSGGVKEYLVEVKPYKQTIPPIPPKINNVKALKRYDREKNVYIRNQTKWKAAMRACEAMGHSFIILTERELGLDRKRR